MDQEAEVRLSVIEQRVAAIEERIGLSS